MPERAGARNPRQCGTPQTIVQTSASGHWPCYGGSLGARLRSSPLAPALSVVSVVLVMGREQPLVWMRLSSCGICANSCLSLTMLSFQVASWFCQEL